MPPGVGLPLRFRRMAPVGAIEGYKIPSRPCGLVAGLASGALMRDPPPRMNDGTGIPGRGVVAGRASTRRRETNAGVVRHIAAHGCGALPIRGVAAVAIGWWYG